MTRPIQQRALLSVLSLALAVSVSCDDGPKPQAAAPAASPRSGGKGGGKGGRSSKPKRVAKAGLDLSDSDFIEGASNRDPFRSFMSEFAGRGARLPTIQRKIIMQRYALDELKLIGVITGGIRARAMFRDPTGLGVSVKRGDYISKSAGRITQILSDRVVIQIQEHAEGAQALADRVVELHPKEEDAGPL